jgi:hypothetical protein
MKIIKSIFIWVVLISPFINIFADVLPKQSFKGQLVIVQELKINNDTVRLGVSSEGQLLRYDGTKYTNWTPDFDSLYSVDSVKYLRGRIQIYQGGNVDSTEVLTVDTTQVLNLQQFVENHSINQELDPVYSIDSSFIKSSLRDIISDTANWNIEDDPIYKSDSSFLKSNIRDWNSSVAKLITAEDTTYWNSKLDIELDPIYSNDSTFLNSGVRNWNSSLAKTIDATDTTHWGRAETDPTISAWAKAATKPTYTKSEVGLSNVDNTSDANKPISTATQTALNNLVPFTGALRDLDMGANSINTDTVKIDGVPLLLNTFKQGNLGGASNIFYSTGASSQPASGSINQVMANNLLEPNRVIKWDGSKFANSPIWQYNQYVIIDSLLLLSRDLYSNGNLYAGNFKVNGDSTNAIVGNLILQNNTGHNLAGIGYGVFYDNTTGYDNVAVGNLNSRFNKKGSGNTSVGNHALMYNVDSYYNVAIGDASLKYTTSDRNTAIGSYAAYNNTTGRNGVFLGNRAGFNNTTLSDLLIIDNQDRGSEANEKLYSLIYGNFNSSWWMQKLRFNASVGIFGDPIQPLTVYGNIYPVSGKIYFDDGYGLFSADDNLSIKINRSTGISFNLGSVSSFFDTNGKLSINKNTATEFLDVNGNIIADTIKARADIITPKLKTGTATNNTTFEADGTMVMNGDATVWDDLFFPFESGETAGTGYPVFVADSSYYTFVVDTTGISKCIKYFTIQLPHSWKEGSTIYPHVHYKHETAIGTPSFKMKYKWYETGQSTDFGWSWYNMTTTTGTTNNTMQMAYNASGINGTGKTVSSILICQVYLSGTPTNVHAYQFDIHIEKDALGSRTQTSK